MAEKQRGAEMTEFRARLHLKRLKQKPNPPELIDLDKVPSSLETIAASWGKKESSK